MAKPAPAKKHSTPIATRAAWIVAALFFLLAAAVLALIGLFVAERSLTPAALMIIALCAAAGVLALVYSRYVISPYLRMERTIRSFNMGLTVDELFRMKTHFSAASQAMLDRFSHMLDRQASLATSKKQAEYLALQNQINPHFLYNTLEAIRGDALAGGLPGIAETTEALATYFRYTISKVEHLVSVGEELKNVGDYFLIQKYRYGDRIQLRVELGDEGGEISKCRLPKLTLQPIVENAIIHGLEPKVGIGRVRISMERTQSRLIIRIADNGIGMGEEAVDALSRRLEQMDFDYIEDDPREGGIALVNVNNRIKLLFGEQYGLTIFSSPTIGTDVEITLPLAAQV